MIYDLHTHSTASDGALTPAELVRLAGKNNVDCLAITDHDTLKAYEQIDAASIHEPRLIVGIELSTVWESHAIHIVGLNVDRHNSVLNDGIDKQNNARASRARTIARRLARIGIDNPLAAVLKIAGSSTVGRPHFAQHLVAIGAVKDISTAFRKYLGSGKIGDVKENWQQMPEIVSWIRAAGGTPVLAHPMKYGMTWSKLRELSKDFSDAGGMAIEVVCGAQELRITRKLADLSNEFELAASCGSDFHQVQSWSAPGRFATLPDSVTKVWDIW